MQITEVLITEHIIFLTVFDQIERALPQASTVSEIRTLAALVQGLLEHHAEVERNLAFAVLDHMLAERGSLEQMHQDHEEIDQTLRQARAAEDIAAARHSLRLALSASRKHFCFEEASVFPQLERILQPETLAALGRLWAESAPSVPSPETKIEAAQECPQAECS